MKGIGVSLLRLPLKDKIPITIHTKETMRKHLTILIFLLIGSLQVYAQEITLFDSNGNARAYIDYNDDATIYGMENLLPFWKMMGTICAYLGLMAIF